MALLAYMLELYSCVHTMIVNFYDVFLQKLYMRHLGHIDDVGGPVKGLVAIVTGPTSGIGVETAAALARRGAHVVLACRSVARGQELGCRLREEAQAKGLPEPSLEVMELDLDSLASVRQFAQRWEGRAAHILVNNAGIYSISAPRRETADGFEAHMGCNHLAHFLLTMALLPALRRGAAEQPGFGARVVSVSSSLHSAVEGIGLADPLLKRSFTSHRAYCQSKLAQILFTAELRRRLPPSSNIHAFAVHPGMVMTEVTRTLPWAMRVMHRLLMTHVLLSPMQGARASIYCATSPAAPQEAAAGQGYFGADCRPAQPSAGARSGVAATWLWRWSAELTDLPADLDLPAPE